MDLDIRLDDNFIKSFNELLDKYGDKLANINGLSNKQLSHTDFIDNFIDTKTVADSSIDGNSNVAHKDIVTLINEMPKPHQKLLAFNKIYYEIEKHYGGKVAKDWLENEWDGHLYLHDSNTSTFVHYCFAYDLKDLAEKGLFFIGEDFNAEPPQHLETFIDFVKEFVSWCCNRSSGAVGLPNLIPYMYYFWQKDVKEKYYTKSPEVYAKQQIQRLIYALNQPFLRGGIQSAFTNTSVFDHPYFEALFGGSKFPDGTYMIDYEEEIIEFQKLFLEAMSEIRSYNMMTFPVNTISLLRKDGKFVDEEFAKYACKHNMKWSDSNLFIDDSVNSLSNCCFDGSQMVLTKSSEGVSYKSFEELYNTGSDFTIFHAGKWSNGNIIRINKDSHKLYKVTTVNNKEIIVTDNHLNPTYNGDVRTDRLTKADYILFNTDVLQGKDGLTYEQGVFIGNFISSGGCLAEYENDKELKDFIAYWTKGTINLACLSESEKFRNGIIDGLTIDGYIKTDSLDLVNKIDVIITSLGQVASIDFCEPSLFAIRNANNLEYSAYKRRNGHVFFKIKSIEEVKNNDEYVYCFEMEDEPYFTLPNGIITHNCRLKSNIKDLGYFNSIGGTALKVGSVKVSTINLARLALESNKSEELYLSNLTKLVNLDLKLLDCIRNIIKRNVDKGLLKNFSNGIVDFEHLYNTIGFIGIYETMKTFGYISVDEFGNTYYTKEAELFGQKIFNVIHHTKDEFTKNSGYMINCEQIPGETAAAKLMKKDEIFYPDTVVKDLPLYGNQFIPLGIKTTLQERIRIASIFDGFCSGGSVLHVNIDAPFSNFEKAWKMLNYVADNGVTYFAFNTKIQVCEHNHAFYGTHCPVCGKPVHTEYTRIVGFYTPIRTWSKPRTQEYEKREWQNMEEV